MESSQRARCAALAGTFTDIFGRPPEALFSAPGRTELGGNHTDHQHGHVLAAAVDLDIVAAAAPRSDQIVRVHSEGYPPLELDLRDLTPQPGEVNTSAALVRGVAARLAQLGCPVRGLDACLTSCVPGGSGLSSSAAFEVLFATAFNALYFDGKCTPLELAQIGQYAENVFFGKPCGLMDQAASAVGGVSAMDFGDPEHPAVSRIELDLAAHGYALCVLDSGAGHADLTDEYAAITGELKAVCACFGKSVLREVPEEDFMAELPAVRRRAGDRAVLRALHFYAEDRRAVEEADALRAGDFDRFLALVRASGRSSALCLQNVIPTGQTEHQELMLAIALCERILGGAGAVRVHGGGFAGTVQVFVPLERLADFQTRAHQMLGTACYTVAIRPKGGIRLDWEGAAHDD